LKPREYFSTKSVSNEVIEYIKENIVRDNDMPEQVQEIIFSYKRLILKGDPSFPNPP